MSGNLFVGLWVFEALAILQPTIYVKTQDDTDFANTCELNLKQK